MGWLARLWCYGAFRVATTNIDLTYGFGKCAGSMDEISKCESMICPEEKCNDCEWAAWSEFTDCSCEGLRTRSRAIKVENSGCGNPCEGNRIETRSCSPSCHPDPIDCVLGEWSMPVACDKDCGGGQTFRERTVIKQPEFAGKPCEGVLKESLPCNVQPCYTARNCSFELWGDWSECSASCDGTQRRDRTVTAGLYGGLPCDGVMAETRPCKEVAGKCGVVEDCVWSDWTKWSVCSATCGGGERGRVRSITKSPRMRGKMCPPKTSSEVMPCGVQACGVSTDCKMGEWTKWDACSCSCNGIQHRVRHVDEYAQGEGKVCKGSLREVQGCNISDQDCNHETTTTLAPTTPEPEKPERHDVAVDCKISDWADWGDCSASCGGGIRFRSRFVEKEPSAIGKPCTAVLQSVESCHTEDCVAKPTVILEAVDCKVTEWESWGQCSTSCGGGEQTRNRQVTRESNEAGKACIAGSILEVKSCNIQECVCADCAWSAWSEWGACSCTGLRDRHRAIAHHYTGCGKRCVGPKAETQRCQPDCEVKSQNCVLEEWAAWSECTVTCGGGTHKRERGIAQSVLNNGNPCDGDLVHIAPCGAQHCEGMVDCEVSEWGEWQQCSATSDGGQQMRQRSIRAQAKNGGEACAASLQEIRGCNSQASGRLQDCRWGEWSEYSACSESCGGGHRNRDRSISAAPQYGGKLCEPKAKSETIPCNTQSCNVGCVDGKWGLWSDWGDCAASCGVSYRVRTRETTHSANRCGKPIDGDFQEFAACAPVPCNHLVTDCQFSDWSDWGGCSCTCFGLRDRSRRIKAYDQNGGKECSGGLRQVVSCNVEVCNHSHTQDCELGDWDAWSTCNAKCGGGQKRRSRDVLHNAHGDGAPCEAVLSEMQGCNTQKCDAAVDCAWGAWNNWGACSHECGGGHQTRFRHIITIPKRNGKPCEAGASTEMQRCNKQACGSIHFCAWDDWDAWSRCSRTCGSGQRKRSRNLSVRVHKPSEDALFAGALDQVHPEVHRLNIAHFSGLFLAGVVFSSMLMALYTRVRHGSQHGQIEFEMVSPAM